MAFPAPAAKRTSAAFAALFVWLTASAAVHAADPEALAKRLFGDHAGCAVLLERDRHREHRLELGSNQCRVALSPCSTFKIPNALIGLQTGAVSGPGDLKAWDGIERPRSASNRDHDLASAFRESIVWYFQALARDVGPKRMQGWIDRLDYGNRDLSAGIDRFWLASSLRIDALGQFELVRRLHHGALPFRPEHQQTVRELMAQPTDLPGALHGKTGSCRGDADGGVPDHGWFVGWVDWSDAPPRNPRTTWFVVNVQGEGAFGREARAVALELLGSPLTRPTP